jgi:hypothetical protein
MAVNAYDPHAVVVAAYEALHAQAAQRHEEEVLLLPEHHHQLAQRRRRRAAQHARVEPALQHVGGLAVRGMWSTR